MNTLYAQSKNWSLPECGRVGLIHLKRLPENRTIRPALESCGAC